MLHGTLSSPHTFPLISIVWTLRGSEEVWPAVEWPVGVSCEEGGALWFLSSDGRTAISLLLFKLIKEHFQFLTLCPWSFSFISNSLQAIRLYEQFVQIVLISPLHFLQNRFSFQAINDLLRGRSETFNMVTPGTFWQRAHNLFSKIKQKGRRNKFKVVKS